MMCLPILPEDYWEGTGFFHEFRLPRPGKVSLAGDHGPGLCIHFDHFDQNQPLFVWLVLGFLLAVVGTGGDLVESLLKRNLQMKDSGSILPGHGGFLDRFDALLLGAPVAFAWLAIWIF